MADAQVRGPIEGRFDEVLTGDAVDFLASLHREFDARRRELLAARGERYQRLANGEGLDFLPQTETSVRTARGRLPQRHRVWSTGGSRSPARPRRR